MVKCLELDPSNAYSWKDSVKDTNIEMSHITNKLTEPQNLTKIKDEIDPELSELRVTNEVKIQQEIDKAISLTLQKNNKQNKSDFNLSDTKEVVY